MVLLEWVIQNINNIILSATLLIIIWYTIETRKLRMINQKQLQILLENNEPSIIAYFDNGKTFYNITFVIKNVGNGIAKNIKVTFNPPYDIGTEVFTEYFNKNALLTKGISILIPRSEYIIRAGHTVSSSKKFKNDSENNKEQIPHAYEVLIEYENQFGKKFNSNVSLSLEQFFNRINPDDLSETEKQLKEINDNLKKLKYAITDLKVDDDNDALETDEGNDNLEQV
ncbi:MAG: hypothetical protein ACOYN6_10115 [Ignavibacteria bacterium]